MNNEDLVLDLFKAIEVRDLDRVLEIYDPEIEFHWPPALPYGGSSRGSSTDAGEPSWQSVWLPLQREPSDQCMDPRVIASNSEEVVVLYHQRGRDSYGNVIDGEVLGLYKVVHGHLRRAQMFYFDVEGLLEFLRQAQVQSS
jgi:hypothetical protein